MYLNFKRILFIQIIFSFVSISVYAQKLAEISGNAARVYLSQIAETSNRMNTMECNFEQIQSMRALTSKNRSEGIMQYKKPNCMRWQYDSPTSYCFIVNKGKVVMKQNGKSIRNGSVRVFSHISKMVLSSITGNNVIDEKNFINSFELSKTIFRITMVPRRAEMRRVFSSITMDFDITTNFIRKIEMAGKNSNTIINFSNKKINCNISDNQFKL
jgi:outer membrane lipoprotein carrier protein